MNLYMDVSSPASPDDASSCPEDTDGECPNKDKLIPDPVNTRTGSFIRQETDVEIPTRGLPLAFERSYSSISIGNGPLGPGWTHTYNMRITNRNADVVRVIAAHGSKLYFHRVGTTFTPLPGVAGTLTLDSESGIYTLTTREHVAYLFDSDGRLISVRDQNGNETTLDYEDGLLTTVTAPDERSLTLAYNEAGHITSLTDPIGRVITYTYTTETENGRLDTVTDFLDGITTYVYNMDGYLEKVIDPENNTLMTNTYNNLGKVTQQLNALGEARTFKYDVPHHRTKVTDANGHQTVYRYNKRGLLAITDDEQNVTHYANNSNFNLKSVEDANGNITRITWDGDNPIIITDPVLSNTVMNYDSQNNLIRLVDPLNHRSYFGYDSFNNLTTITYAVTSTVIYTASLDYDEYGQLSGSVNPRGYPTEYKFDEFGNLTAITNTLGYATRFGYDSVGRLNWATDANDHTTTFGYDLEDHLVAITQTVDSQELLTTLEYYPDGQLWKATDANQHATTYEYNAANWLVAVTDARNGVMRYGYDAVGNLTVITDTEGLATTIEYDNLNRPIVITDPIASPSYFEYDPVGNLRYVWDANGHQTEYRYDARDRLTMVIDDQEGATSYQYDAIGNLTSVTNANGETTYYHYDEQYHLKQVIDPLGHITSYGYDPMGNLTSFTEANTYTTYYTYDELNRLTQVTDPLTKTTIYDYDPVGNLTSVLDANQHTTTYGYDEINRLIQVNRPVVPAAYFDYDGVGNLTGVTDPNDVYISYTYDELNRLTDITYPDSAVEYAYDTMGNRVAMTDTTGVTHYDYDNLYRLESVTDSAEQTVGYTYDSDGNLHTITYPNSETITYTYDTLNRLTAVDGLSSGEALYQYDAVGQVLTATLPNGIVSSYTYDDAGRLKTIEHSLDGELLSYFEYEYDTAGNRTNAIETGFEPFEPPQITETSTFGWLLEEGQNTIDYTYDPLNRLTSAVYQVGESSETASYDYTYDDVGNRLSQEICVPGEDCVWIDYEYDGLNRLASVNDQSYTWDNNGNLLSDGVITYTYDYANRLVSVSNPLLEIENHYNGDGLRVDATVNEVAIHYTYDVNASLPVVLAETQDESTVLSYYGLGLVAQRTQNDWSYLLHDALGSTRQATDDAGELTASYQYDPFGVLSTVSSWEDGSTTSFLFTGEQLDLSNLYYLRARYYDPTTGRFTSVDPFPGIITLPDTLNPYLYSLNNPVNWVDPSGKFSLIPNWDIDWDKVFNIGIAVWDYGTATITTVGYVFIGLGALSLDPGVILFGELLTIAGSALATVPMSLTLLKYGIDCEASGTAVLTWTWGALMTGFAPGDLFFAWYQFYYDVTELFK